MKNPREIIDLCAEHGIGCEIETTRIDQLKTACGRFITLRRRYVAFPLLLVCAAVTACISSHPIDVTTQPKLQPDVMVEFKHGGQNVQLDAVLFSRDSVSGIPWHEPSLCCKRVAYALADISPPNIRTFPAAGAILLGVAGVFVGFLVALGITLHGYSD